MSNYPYSHNEYLRRRDLQRRFAYRLRRRGVNHRLVAFLAAQRQRRFDRIFGGLAVSTFQAVQP